MRLTREDHGERLRRFSHLKPARTLLGLGRKPCGVTLPGEFHACTRAAGHRGPHVAHGFLGEILAVWTREDGSGSEPRRATPARRRPAVQRRTRSDEDDGGALAALWGRALRVLSSPEELALVLLFLGLLVFGLDVARRIVAGW